MSRPLAWVLALVVLAVSVLLVVVPRVSPDRLTPDPDTVLARQASTSAAEVELASVSDVVARPEADRSGSDALGARASALRIPEGAIEVRVVPRRTARRSKARMS